MAFNARYGGTCRRCGGAIREGERIESAGYKAYRHTGCEAPAPEPSATTSPEEVPEGEMYEDKMQRIDNQEYAEGYAAAKQYLSDVKTYGRDLAEEWEMEREMADYNRGY